MPCAYECDAGDVMMMMIDDDDEVVVVDDNDVNNITCVVGCMRACARVYATAHNQTGVVPRRACGPSGETDRRGGDDGCSHNSSNTNAQCTCLSYQQVLCPDGLTCAGNISACAALMSWNGPPPGQLECPQRSGVFVDE